MTPLWATARSRPYRKPTRRQEVSHVETRVRAGARKPPPAVPPVRVAVAPPLALPEREPRNILMMIAIPALLVGIIGTLVVMYTSGVRSLQSGFFPMMGLFGFGALMFSGRFGRARRISWGEQEKQRRSYLRQLDEDREEVQRAAQEQKRSQLFLHGDPEKLDTVIGGPACGNAAPTTRISWMCVWGLGFSKPAIRRCRCSGRGAHRRGAGAGNRRCAKGFHPRAKQDPRNRQGVKPAVETWIQLH
ncbi:putative cell division FtsK/SpoIIIE [Mycobacterium xenopi 3993]|nr:putative cell division FtsK/SpoIIIE [Mycobacterium xenopi 3993]